MKEILERIRGDVDDDIIDFLLADSTQDFAIENTTKKFWANYELLADPVQTALHWQALREMKK